MSDLHDFMLLLNCGSNYSTIRYNIFFLRLPHSKVSAALRPYALIRNIWHVLAGNNKVHAARVGASTKFADDYSWIKVRIYATISLISASNRNMVV